MSISRRVRAGALAIVLVASAAVLAQSPVKFLKQVKGAKGVKESTLSQNPQIRETVLPTREHENDYTPQFGIFGVTNSLPVGEVGNFYRGILTGKFAGISWTGYFPPDCDFAVSSTHAVAVVNLDLAFFNKNSGQKLFQTDFATFFSSLGLQGNLSDPKVFFDRITGRFFVEVMEYDTSDPGISKINIGVSDDGDPNGVWFKYRIESHLVIGQDSWWLDYPSWAGNKDALIITGNMFPVGNQGYGGSIFIVVTKAQLLTGGQPTITYFYDSAAPTVQPARTYDPALDRIFLSAAFGSTQFKLYMFSNLLGNPPTTDTKLVTVPSWQIPTGLARSQGSQGLDSFDGRIFTSWWRGNKLVMAHTVKDSGANNTMCRWYEFSTTNWISGGSPSLTQSGNVRSGGSSEDFHMPAICINKFNDIALTFTRSGPNIVADIMTTGRRSSDPQGQMGIPKKIEGSGNGPYQAYRWGDYFAIGLDPSDETSFYAYGMVANGNSWATKWDKFLISGGIGDGIPVPPTTITMYEGTSSSGTAADVATSDDLYFTVKSHFVAKLGHVAGFEASFTLAQGASDIDFLTFRHEGKGAAGSTAFLYLYNWGTGDYDFLKAFSLKDTDFKTDLNLTGYGLSKYVSAANEVQMLVRAIEPNRPRGSIPAPFDFKTDLLNLLVVPKT